MMNAGRGVGAPAMLHVRGIPQPIKAGAFLLLSALVFGCGPFVETNSVNPETAARLDSEVKLYQPSEVRSLKYTTIGKIEAWSCKNKLWDPDPTQGDALSQMKLKASSFGAKGIVDVQCSGEGTGLDTNCWSSIVCVGTAIKLDADAGMNRNK